MSKIPKYIRNYYVIFIELVCGCNKNISNEENMFTLSSRMEERSRGCVYEKCEYFEMKT